MGTVADIKTEETVGTSDAESSRNIPPGYNSDFVLGEGKYIISVSTVFGLQSEELTQLLHN